MNNLIKWFLIFNMLLIPTNAFALEFDLSVDEEIRKNYKPSELEIKQLPKIPNVDKTTITPTQKVPQTKSQTPAVPKTQLNPVQKGGTKKVTTMPKTVGNSVVIDNSTVIKLKKGTKFKVQSLTKISDLSSEGSRMTFKTLEPVTQRYITIPTGTIIRGTLVETHPPQMSGNGGLIVVKVDGITYKGSQKSLVGKVTKANSKKIFFNNIKGKRKYLVNVPTYAKKGKPFYRKMMNATNKLSQNPVSWILTPFTVVSGVVVYGTTIVASPVSALFSKGGHITIPAGAKFELKLTEDVFMH